MRALLAPALLAASLIAPAAARAQAFLPFDGFSPLPAFAWARPEAVPSWDGSYGRISTGFMVASSRHAGTFAGPTFGAEAGRMWREGNLVYGIAGGFDAVAPFGNYGSGRYGSLAYTRDFAGALQVKVGALLSDNVLVYTKLGAFAAHENLRFGPSPLGPGFSREDIAVGPDARVGVEWAITDRLTVGIEAGVAPAARLR